MPWNANWPDQTRSVSGNTTTGQENTTYTKTTLNSDHFWNIAPASDGHHRFVQTVATNEAAHDSPINMPLAAGIDLSYFSRYKTSVESSDPLSRNCQPFVKDIGPAGEVSPWSAGVMQLLAIRACAVFSFPPPAGTLVITYSHNISGITNAHPGEFIANFAVALPSNNYMILGGAIQNDLSLDKLMEFSVCGATVLTTVKSDGMFQFRTKTTGGTPTPYNPLNGWFIVFGG